jgi:hypothetical protein
MRSKRLTITVGAAVAAATIGLTGCSHLPYGCHRQSSHGPVICHNTNHNPSAAAVYPPGRALHQPHKPPVVLALPHYPL